MSSALIAGICLAALASLFASTLTYSLRHFSRARLSEVLHLRGKSHWLDPIVINTADLVFVMAVCRLLTNVLVLLGMLCLFETPGRRVAMQYFWATVTTLIITFFSSVALPGAAAKYAGETIIGFCAPVLNAIRVLMFPVTSVSHAIDRLIRHAAGGVPVPGQEQIEKDILSVVEQGEKGGIVDVQEREMIQSVIEFRDTQVGQIMTARPEIVGLPLGSALAEVKRTLEESGHSRVPIYDGTLDQIVGILYARDLLKHLGLPPEQFDIRSAIRPAIYVPETKPLRDLLHDFRMQKVHIAIVLDEYGGTAGLVSIEDILEELVGDISDEHEPQEPAMLKRIDDHTWDADARIYVDELNRQLGLALPDDAGYDTLGGFVSNTLGRIPAAGTQFDHAAVRYTILDAEPAKVNRVKIELPQNASITSADSSKDQTDRALKSLEAATPAPPQ